MQFYDRLTLDKKARICADGTLVAEVFAARTGIQNYTGAEADPDGSLGLRDKAVVKVYRPPEEVFARDSMASYSAAPITLNHPTEDVNASNWQRLGKGEIHGDVVRDGERIKVPVIVRDVAAVRAAQTTHKQLSMGYSCTLDATPGALPGGETYDAVQRNIRVNHLALVPAARGGPELSITDERPNLETQMRIKIGDAEVDATNAEAVRVAVDALNLALTAARTSVGTLTADLATVNTTLSTRDGENAALKAQLADANDPAKVQALSDARTNVITRAKALVPTLVADGKTVEAIRREAVGAKLGDAAKDFDDAAVTGAFTALTADGVAPIAQGGKVHDARPTGGVADMAAFRDSVRAGRNA